MECFELVAGVLTTKALEAPPTGKYYYDAHGNGRSLFISEFLDTELSEVPFSRLEILLSNLWLNFVFNFESSAFLSLPSAFPVKNQPKSLVTRDSRVTNLHRTAPEISYVPKKKQFNFHCCLQKFREWRRPTSLLPRRAARTRYLCLFQTREGSWTDCHEKLTLLSERKLDSSLLFETIKQRLEDPKIDEDFIYILTTAKTSPIALHNNPLSLIDRSFDLNGGWLETIWNLLSIKTLLSKWSYHVEFRFAYRAFKKCRNTANFQERARLIVADWSDRTCLDPFGVKEKYFRKIYDMLDEEGRNCLVLNSLVSQR